MRFTYREKKKYQRKRKWAIWGSVCNQFPHLNKDLPTAQSFGDLRRPWLPEIMEPSALPHPPCVSHKRKLWTITCVWCEKWIKSIETRRPVDASLASCQLVKWSWASYLLFLRLISRSVPLYFSCHYRVFKWQKWHMDVKLFVKL